jgi:uncharacterized small protein (DUF1192 family)
MLKIPALIPQSSPETTRWLCAEFATACIAGARSGLGRSCHKPILVAFGRFWGKDISRLLSKGHDNFANVVATCRAAACRAGRAGAEREPGAVRGVTSTAAAAKIVLGDSNMPAVDDDDKPKKKIAHEIGQDLTLLSAGELTDRITLLRDEIVRLEADMARKNAVKSAADMFFKK